MLIEIAGVPVEVVCMSVLITTVFPLCLEYSGTEKVNTAILYYLLRHVMSDALTVMKPVWNRSP